MKLFFLSILATVAVHAGFAAAPTGRYKAALDVMQQLQKAYPDKSALFSVGTNDDGTDIIAMRVSVTPNQTDPRKVGHLVVSTHHGNELKATDFTLAYTKNLLERYRSRELYSGNLADIEWIIIPVLNVSGYNAATRYERGTDPNRDYPGPCNGGTGGRLKSIRLVMDLLNSRPFAASVTVHGYIGTITYPWGVNTTNTHSNDHNAYDRIFAQAAAFNGYRYGTSTDLIYSAEGTFEDYVYWKHGIWSLLLEMRDGSANDIKTSVPAIQTFFDQVDSSASKKNQMTGKCARAGNRPDLRID
jgi:carboxypeptidase T